MQMPLARAWIRGDANHLAHRQAEFLGGAQGGALLGTVTPGLVRHEQAAKLQKWRCVFGNHSERREGTRNHKVQRTNPSGPLLGSGVNSRRIRDASHSGSATHELAFAPNALNKVHVSVRKGNRERETRKASPGPQVSNPVRRTHARDIQRNQRIRYVHVGSYGRISNGCHRSELRFHLREHAEQPFCAPGRQVVSPLESMQAVDR